MKINRAVLTAISIVTMALLFFSCDRAAEMKDSLFGESNDSTGAAATGSGFFEGTITARQELMSSGAILSSTIEYNIAKHKISRKVKDGGITAFTDNEAGVIIDLKEDSVTVFQRDALKKLYCKMSIGAYRKEMKLKAGVDNVSHSTPYESIFLPLAPAGAVMKNQQDTVTILKMKCDLLDIVQGNNHWEIQHCRPLKVKRELVELMFFNIPLQSEGFPCIYKFEVLSGSGSQPAAGDDVKLLNKMLKALDKVVAAITECSIEVKEIKPGKPEFFDKEIIEGYERVGSLADLEAEFAPSGGYDD
jgi:hypothetical protein